MRPILVTLLVALPASIMAQSSEIWPELDVYWRPAEHQRTFLELAMSNEREGTKREGSVGVYQDYLRLPRAYLRAGVRYTFSTRDASYREPRVVAEGTVGGDVAARARLVNRFRTELRWVNGAYSYRLRDRLHLQRVSRATRGFAPAPYATFEAYYDSRFATIARVGGRVGTEGRLGGPVSIDVFVARQNNLRSVPKYVNALGLIAKLNY